MIDKVSKYLISIDHDNVDSCVEYFLKNNIKYHNILVSVVGGFYYEIFCTNEQMLLLTLMFPVVRRSERKSYDW